jgi:putative phosphoribosyl transferase
MQGLLFSNRKEAGRLLADALVERNLADVVVLALPRGGVPIAMEVARALSAPLDLVLVRKLGAPSQPELALGAVVDGADPHVVLNDDIVRELGVQPAAIDQIVARELAVIERRRTRWLAGRPSVPLSGRTAVIVDDGIATGATVKAAIDAVRRQGASHIVVATPVAPADTVFELARLADDVVVLSTPEPFGAIGRFYIDFTQVTDDEVAAMLGPAA